MSFTLEWPLKGNYTITDTFGKREPIYIPELDTWTLPFHYGIDFAAPEGTPLYAMEAGQVKLSEWDNSGYGGGWTIAIASANGVADYMHLQERSHLRAGQRVKRGDYVGKLGATGAVTGAHAHIEYSVQGEPINFMKYLGKGIQKRMRQTSHTLEKPLKVTCGKRKRVRPTKTGALQLKIKEETFVSATLSISGTPGDVVHVAILEDGYTKTNSSTTKTRVMRRGQAIIDSRGISHATVAGVCKAKPYVRYRVAVINVAKNNVYVKRLQCDYIDN